MDTRGHRTHGGAARDRFFDAASILVVVVVGLVVLVLANPRYGTAIGTAWAHHGIHAGESASSVVETLDGR